MRDILEQMQDADMEQYSGYRNKNPNVRLALLCVDDGKVKYFKENEFGEPLEF